MTGFAIHANESLPAQKQVGAVKEEFTLEWFKQELIEAGVSRLHVEVWENYKEEFPEVPHHLMRSYLHHRKYFLHKKALAQAEKDYAAMENHPFSI